MRKAWMVALMIAVAAGAARGQGANDRTSASFQIPFRVFFYDVKLDTGRAEIPSEIVQAFVDSAGVKHRLTWRPGFDVRVSARRKHFGLPPYKARVWQVSSVAVSLEADLDGKSLTRYQFQIKREDRFEVAVRDSAFVTRDIPGGEFHSPLVDIARPRLTFQANEEILRTAFEAEVKVVGKMKN